MGEKRNRPFQLSLNASLKVGFQGSRVTSDGGLLLVRELDERLGFGAKVSNFEQTRAAQEAFICETCFKDRNSSIVWGSWESKEVKTEIPV